MKHKSYSLVVELPCGVVSTFYAGAKTEKQAVRKTERDTKGKVLSVICLGEESE